MSERFQEFLFSFFRPLFVFAIFIYTVGMSFIIVGLGNPGQEYEGTRHNTGRMMLFALAKEIGIVEAGDEHGAAAEFKADKKLRALVAKGEIGKGKKAESVTLIAPETFMNKSGLSVGS